MRMKGYRKVKTFVHYFPTLILDGKKIRYKEGFKTKEEAKVIQDELEKQYNKKGKIERQEFILYQDAKDFLNAKKLKGKKKAITP